MEVTIYHFLLFVVFFIQILFIHFTISTSETNYSITPVNQTNSNVVFGLDEWLIPFPERIHLG